MNKKLIDYLKNISGNVLAIGIDDINIINALNNNSKILDCYLIESISNENEETGKNKKILPRHIRKLFKKKSIDYFIFNHKIIKKYLNIYIKDSIYLTRGQAIIMTDDKKLIKKMYKQYNLKTNDQEFLLIDINDTKTNKIKELKFDFLYKIESTIDYISDSLIN